MKSFLYYVQCGSAGLVLASAFITHELFSLIGAGFILVAATVEKTNLGEK